MTSNNNPTPFKKTNQNVHEDPESNYNLINDDFNQKESPKSPVLNEFLIKQEKQSIFNQENQNATEVKNCNKRDSETSKSEKELLSNNSFNAKSKTERDSFLGKKTTKQKDKSKKAKTKNDSEQEKDNKDNLIKESLKAPFPFFKKMIEKFGNIKHLNDVNLNVVFGGIEQNRLALNSKFYQLLCFDNEIYDKKNKKGNEGEEQEYNKKKLENANPENEKYFNYFLTREYKYLYSQYYQKKRVFNIEGNYEIIDDFKTFDEVLAYREKKYYKNDSAGEKLKKIEKFKNISSEIFNDFKNCKKRQPRYPDKFKKFKEKIKEEIPRFENYLEKEKINNSLGSSRIEFKSMEINSPYNPFDIKANVENIWENNSISSIGINNNFMSQNPKQNGFNLSANQETNINSHSFPIGNETENYNFPSGNYLSDEFKDVLDYNYFQRFYNSFNPLFNNNDIEFSSSSGQE